MKTGLVALVLGSVLSINAFANELKVGDKMPVSSLDGTIYQFNSWSSEDNLRKGTVISFYDGLNLELSKGQFYNSCGGTSDFKLPFLIYDVKSNTFYVDNDLLTSRNGKMTDGYIDQIIHVENNNLEFSSYAPVCGLNQKRA